jgi:1,4-alpha-glucan branching enzyme
MQQLVRDLNRLYAAEPALHASDIDPAGFHWAVGDDAEHSVLAWWRYAGGAPPALVVCNLTPAPLPHYRIGVPREGRWQVRLNTDASEYGGSGAGDAVVHSEPLPLHQQAHSVGLSLPPLATVILIADR